MIYVVDFGSQVTQLIARRVRESGVYCEIVSSKSLLSLVKKQKTYGIIFSGGPASVHRSSTPRINKQIYKMGIPILGICYGMQLMVHQLGGKVQMSKKREFGKTAIKSSYKSLILKGFNKGKKTCDVWMSHGDKVITLPEGFNSIASSTNTKFAATENKNLNFYGLQFHPEVVHTLNGHLIIQNFIFKICKCKKNWSMQNHLQTQKK